MFEVIIFTLIPIVLFVGLSVLLVKTKKLDRGSSIIKWISIFSLVNLVYTSITYFLMASGCNSNIDTATSFNDLCGLGWYFLNLHNGPVEFLILTIRIIPEPLDFFIASLITGAIIGLIIKFVFSRMRK